MERDLDTSAIRDEKGTEGHAGELDGSDIVLFLFKCELEP